MNNAVVRACMLSFYFAPSYSGSAVQAKNLSLRLRERGVAPLIVSANLTQSPKQDLVDDLPHFRLPVCKRNDLQIPSFWLSLVWFLLRKRHSIDIIHAHGTFPHAIASLVGRWLGKPTILKIAMAHSDIAFHKHGRIWGRINRFLVNRFDCYVATSAEVYQECVDRGLDAACIHVIPNGVDTDVFYPAPSAESRSESRRNLGLPNRPTVCYVGVIDARKNLDGILRVWKMVQDRTRMGQLVLIGPKPRGQEEVPGPFYQGLLKYVSDNGLSNSVTFAGQHPDVPSCLRSADIFLFPSRREGMPNALLEAMASGLACVASNIGGSSDLIRHGENGYLFAVDDEVGMATAIEELLRRPDHAAAMGTAARQTIVRQFSLKATAQRYLELYAMLLKRSTSPLKRTHSD